MDNKSTTNNNTINKEDSQDMAKESKFFKLKRYFTKPGIHPFDEIDWVNSRVHIQNESGQTLFDYEVEHPDFWNYMSVRTCADKYFKTEDLENHPKGGERSVRDVMHRVAYGISNRGKKAGYIDDEGEDILYNELCHILIHQYAAFNSPVFFNMGLYDVYGLKGNSKAKRYAIKDRDGEVYEQEFENQSAQASACKSGDTWIYTNKGPMYLEDLVNNFSSLENIKVLSSKGFSKIENAKFNGIKDTYKITFRDGNELRITEDDEIFANFNRKDKKFRTISSIINDKNKYKYNSNGYRVHTRLNNNYLFEKNINNLSIAKSAICGWIQTDGFYGPSGTSTCLDLLTQFDEEEEIFSYLREIYPNKNIKSSLRKNIKDESLKLKSHRIYGSFLKEIWEDEYDLVDLENSVPRKIKFGTYEEVIAYLRSAFQAEGSVSFRGNNIVIQWGVVNKNLAYDIFYMLRSLGIFSRIKKKVDKRDNRRDAYCISINNYSECDKFHNIIGFIGKRKNSKLDLYLNKLKGKGKTKNVDDFWSSIKSIEYYGKEKVYDIETEAHDFYANGVLVHNCFITEVVDELVNGENGIYDWINTEMAIFSNGSGSGLNVSRIRGEGESITGGGSSSGVLSFLKVADTSAGSIKSGGKTRRSAKMVILEDSHPDLIEFVNWKKKEEFKARSMILNGFDSAWNSKDGVYSSIQGQNANNSVSVTDDFMQSVVDDKNWDLKYILNNEIKKTYKANELFDELVDAAWECGDPGLYYKDTIQKWNTLPNTDEIRATNPCGEFLHIDNTSCNLASLNLSKYFNDDKTFDIETYISVIETMIFAMEVIVGIACYPSRKIAEMTKDTRPLGLGYCNMGGLIMMLGYPYDSDQARSIISTITSLKSAVAYTQSAKIASVVGPFKEFNKNKKEFINIIKMHQECNDSLKPRFKFVKQIHSVASEYWKNAVNLISKYGARNSQVVVIAPTGTIMFIMGTTNNGIEPAFSLTSWKLMSDGSSVQLLCEEVQYALQELGYNKKQVKEIFSYIKNNGHVEGAPHLNPRHIPIFDTANVNGNGTRYIKPMAHVEAVAAATPFVSGGISKTINLPHSATREEMKECYIEGWKLGCKALSLYRDGSKWSQPLNSNNDSQKEIIKEEIERAKDRIRSSGFNSNYIWDYHRGLNTRKRAGNRAPAERLNFNLGGENIHYNVVRYPTNGISEMWIEVGKENPTVNGLADTIGRIISIAIQYGVPISALSETLDGLQFSPAGFLGENDLQIRSSKSISDLTAKVLRSLQDEYESQNIQPSVSASYTEIINDNIENTSESCDGIECEYCGSKRTKGTVKCGICLDCGTTYGSCS